MKILVISVLIVLIFISLRVLVRDPKAKILKSAQLYVEQNGFSLENTKLLIDTNNQSWETMNALLENSPREGLHQILPNGVNEADLQVVKLAPRVEHTLSTVLIFVNKNNYETLGSLGVQ